MVAARAIADTPPAARRPLDVAGVSTLGVAMALLVAGLVELRHPHAGSEAIALLAAAVLVLAGFAVVERTRRQPMLDPRLLTRAPFLASVLGALFTGLAVVGLMSYCPAFTERALGLSALGSAAVLAAWSVTSTAVALAARSLPARLAPRTRLATGLALAAAGEAGLSGLGVGASWAQLVPGLVLAGVGTGLANAALGRVAVDSVPRGQAGMGSGANNTARYLGAAAGAAVVLTIAAGRDTAELVHGWNAAALVTAALGALGALIVAACRPKVQGPVSGAMPDAPRAGRPEHDRATESVH
jgi:MFS family permease